MHKGATSQDIVDTAAMLLARQGLDAIGADLAAAAAAAARLAAGHRSTIMIGRTLLQQAVPITFGLVAAGWLAALDDARAGLARVRSERLAVQFGGAAGTLAALGDDGPRVAALLAEELDLPAPPLPWHTDRLRVLELAAALAGADSVLSKIARDVTLLAQTEVAEVREGPGGPAASPGGGSPRRGGSSAMPNKQNPVAAVAILGCAKRAPGLLATLAAAGEQEHQRAAGAWHAEWEPLADLLTVTGSAASWAADLLGGLVVDKARMSANLAAAHGLPLAEHVTSLLAGTLGGPPPTTWWPRPGPARCRPGCRCGTPCSACPGPPSSWSRPGSPPSRSTRPWIRPATWGRPESSPTRRWPRTTVSPRMEDLNPWTTQTACSRA